MPFDWSKYEQSVFGTAPTEVPNPERLAPPPEPRGLFATGLDKLRQGSQWVQENLSVNALEREFPTFAHRSGIAPAFEAAGKTIGALPAAIGSGQAERMFMPGILWSETARLPQEAREAGMAAGLEEAGTRGKDITALDVVSGLPGRIGRLASAADATLGVGDIYGGVTDPGLSLGERTAAVGMGAFRVGANTAGLLTRPPATPKSPAVAEAVTQAKVDNSRMLPPPTAEAAGFREELPPVALTGEVSPQANQVLSSFAQTALQEANAAIGGSPVQRVVLLPGQEIPLPDGTLHPIAGRAAVLNDTIFLTKNGQLAALQGDDAAGVAHNIAYLVSHEVWHPKGELGRATQSVDPITGQPVDAPVTGPEGHAAGGLFDDRTKDLDQMYQEMKLRDQVLKSPAMAELAKGVGDRGMLDGAVQPRGGTSILEGTYHPEVLQLAHELGYFGEGAPKPSIWEPANYPATPEVTLELQGPGAKMTPPPVAAEPSALQAALTRVDPELTLAQAGGGKERPPTPHLDALRGVRPKPRVQQPQVTDLAELPGVEAYIQRYRTQKNERGALGRLGRDAHFQVLDTLVDAVREGRFNMDAARQLGVGYGDLAPLENNLRQAINAKYGGIGTPEGRAWLEKLQLLKSKLPRLTGSNPRAVQTELGTATPRQAQAHTSMQERSAGLKASKKEVRQAERLERSEAEYAQRQAKVGEAREAARDIITYAKQEPSGLKKLSNWATRVMQKIEALKESGQAAALPAKVRQAVNDSAAKVDRTLGRETLEQVRQRKMREAAGIAEAPVRPAAELPEADRPRIAKPPKPKISQAGGGTGVRERVPEGTLSEVADALRKLKPVPIEGPFFQAKRKVTTKSFRTTGSKGKEVTRPVYTTKARQKKLGETPGVMKNLVEQEAERRQAELVARQKDAPLPERKRKAEPAKFEAPPETPGVSQGWFQRVSEKLKNLPRPTVKEVRDVFAKGAKLKGTFKAAAKKYPTPQELKTVVNRGTMGWPRRGSLARDAVDVTALTRLDQFINMNAKQLKKFRLDAAVIKQAGATKPTTEKLIAALERVTKLSEDGPTRTKLFQEELRKLKEPLEGDAFRHYKPGWSPATLEKELAKAAPEGKPTTFKERSGPVGAKKWGRHFVREWTDKAGKPLEDRLGGASVVARELSKIFGQKVEPEWVEAHGTRALRQKKAPKGRVTSKTKLDVAGKELKLYTTVETAKDYALAHGITDNEFVNRIPDEMPEGAAEIKSVPVMRQGFEFPGTGELSGKGASGIPRSLQPLKKPEARPTGGRPGARKTPEFPEMPKGGSREGSAGLYGQRLEGDLGTFESAIETPRLATDAGIASLSDQKAKGLYVRNAVNESLELLKGHMDELGASGRLVTPEVVAKMKKKQYDYPDLVEEVAEGRRIDPDTEYYVDAKNLKALKDRFASKAERDFDAQVAEGLDARAVAQEQAETLRGSLREQMKRPPEPMTKELKQLLQTAPRLGTMKEAIAWVDRQVATGGIPQGQRYAAIQKLQSREAALQRFASREVKAKPKISQAGGGTGRTEVNASGESAASSEAMSRMKQMRAKGETFVVYNKGGAKRILIGPEAVDYRARPGETYGIETAKGFRPLDDLGGRYPKISQAGGGTGRRDELPFRTRVGLGIKHSLPQGRAKLSTNAIDQLTQQMHELKASKGEPLSTKQAEQLLDIIGQNINIGRPLLTSADVSNPLRQTYQLTMDQLVQDAVRISKGGLGKGETSFTKNVGDMLRAFSSEGKAKQLFETLHQDSYYNLGKEIGVDYITEKSQHESWIGKAKFDQAISKVAQLPVFKQLKWFVNGAERSFKYYQNKAMRDAVKTGIEFYATASRLQPKEWKITVEGMKDLAKHINNAASRGKISNDPKLNKLSGYLLFSGQMLASRTRMLGSVATNFRTYATPLSRRYARRQTARAMVGAVASTSAIFGLAAAAGLKPSVETDTRSTDFGKIKVGNITFDNGGGFLQLIRVVSQLQSGQQKERGTGLIKPRSFGDTFWTFLRSKAAPGVGLILDLKSKRTVEGEPLDFERDPYGSLGTLVKNTILPMSADDINDLIQENPKAWFLGIPMLLGASIGTDVPSSARTWRTTPELKEQELKTRQELRKYGVMPPTTGQRVTLPGRDFKGQVNYYTLSPAEKAEFDELYMPVVTKLLAEVLESEVYKRLPETKRSAFLYKYVHQLNKRYGVATRGKKEYAEKFRRGEVKPSNIQLSEKIKPLPGGGEVRYSEEEE